MARELRETLARELGVVIEAPSPFSVVAFRWQPEGMRPEAADEANRRILERVNADGRSFISHAILRGRYALRVAIGNVRTERRHITAFLDSLRQAIAAESPAP
jgi:aromatic-L-amino-acid decarboxylase